MLVAPERLPGLAHIIEQVLQGNADLAIRGDVPAQEGRDFDGIASPFPIKTPKVKLLPSLPYSARYLRAPS